MANNFQNQNRRPPPPRLAGPPARTAPNGHVAPTFASPAGPQEHKKAPSISIKDASSEVKDEPLRLVVYGVEGVGKTSLGANAPRPIILGAEKGATQLRVKKLFPKSYNEFESLIDELASEEHSYQTLVIDSLDWLEPLVWDEVCSKAGKSSIEAFGYGKGYNEAAKQWRALFAKIEAMQERRSINVILIAHSVIKTFKNPDPNLGDYDRYQLKINEKAAGLVKEWANAVLFANHERTVVEKNNRERGVDTGKRILYTQMSASYDAKNRLFLAPEIPLSWFGLDRAIKEGRDLRRKFEDALDRMEQAARDSAVEYVEMSGYSFESINQIINASETSKEVTNER